MEYVLKYVGNVKSYDNESLQLLHDYNNYQRDVENRALCQELLLFG